MATENINTNEYFNFINDQIDALTDVAALLKVIVNSEPEDSVARTVGIACDKVDEVLSQLGHSSFKYTTKE